MAFTVSSQAARISSGVNCHSPNHLAAICSSGPVGLRRSPNRNNTFRAMELACSSPCMARRTPSASVMPASASFAAVRSAVLKMLEGVGLLARER